MRVVHEGEGDMSFVKAFGVESIVENCEFCKQPTRYWHIPTNNPVCPECAKTHKVSELHNWRKGKRRTP